MGKRIRKTLNRAASYAGRKGWIKIDGKFLFDPAQKLIHVRNRSDLESTSRKLDFVASIEIIKAIEQITKKACGITSEELPVEVCRMLGFSRVSQDMNERVQALIEELLQSSRLARQNGHLLVIETEKRTHNSNAKFV